MGSLRSSRGPASGLGNTKFFSKEKEVQETSATLPESAEVSFFVNAKKRPAKPLRYSFACCSEISKLCSVLKQSMVSCIKLGENKKGPIAKLLS